MGLASRFASRAGPLFDGKSRTGQFGQLLLAGGLYWSFDAIIDLIFSSGRTYQSLVSPSPHELADRFLVFSLAACFVFYGSRVSKRQGALEMALEEALLKAEGERARIVAIVEAMGDAISIQDPQLKVLYQNGAHQELMGSHIGERCYEAYRSESEPCRDCHLLEAFSDGEVHRVEVERSLGNGIRCVEIIASALRDPAGVVTAGIEVVRNITDRKLVEQALKKEAALLQHLIDTIPNPIYHQDLSGRFLWCNTAFAEWLAKPRELVIGKTISQLAPEPVCRLFLEQDPGPEQGTVYECSIARADGELGDMIFYKSMFDDDAGERAGVVGVMIDITNRKRAEDEVIALNAALMQQALELGQANRDLKAFSHAVSHDLRTPLTRIYSSGQALQDYVEFLDANGLFFVKAINDGCQQVEALLDALMVLSRVTEAKVEMQEVDLSSIAERKGAELQQSEPERQVRLRIAPRLLVQGDPQLLSIAIENLLANAWKYTVRAAEPAIELGSFLSPEGETVFFLKDNGAGFDSERTDQLFKPFRRLHSPQEFPGTGLGLATVRRILLRHNGRIWGEGQTGTGATFYFTVNG